MLCPQATYEAFSSRAGEAVATYTWLSTALQSADRKQIHCTLQTCNMFLAKYTALLKKTNYENTGKGWVHWNEQGLGGTKTETNTREARGLIIKQSSVQQTKVPRMDRKTSRVAEISAGMQPIILPRQAQCHKNTASLKTSKKSKSVQSHQPRGWSKRNQSSGLALATQWHSVKEDQQSETFLKSQANRTWRLVHSPQHY